ncbi:MAG: tRNA 4-thiouridine(8) synthase ThiI [Candidatus Methanomethylophilus sp.]|nr:tRNA 4-thiouridine(8) synthase ThiI [Methanomethylophilus sp.]MBQ4368814.1 tRNA 4-thiouridine(8) synthase ThiI [Methanomethylophilus sp.]MBQ4412406.1 tRNA 4-thiouridine(8) synthase ThiI [Methanomethylophilus sp.]MBQ5483466.1 tRNA 4-thiouridine(8) synthase ThiI [Methanomethylophilus sp.]
MKVLCLLSGGIDSPVAAYLMSKVGAEVVLLHMDLSPYADERLLGKVKKQTEALRLATGKDIPLYAAPHGMSQQVIVDKADSLYRCILCKHVMQLTAKNLCQKLGASAIVMGDSLGQVASQTLMNIRSEVTGVGIPIIRPLIGYDKLEIIEIAKKIGTYEISNMEARECTIVPKKVVTESDVKKSQELYEAIDSLALAEKAAEDAVRVL